MTLDPQPRPADATSDELTDALQATIDRAREAPLYRDRLAGVRLRAVAELRELPLTTRAELQQAGVHGTRAAGLAAVCHYGESSGTTGVPNSAWLTAGDLTRSARAIQAAHPDVFGPGRVILNRFPFMAAPAHLIELIAQRGGGVSVPAGNINWDVPFPRALELAHRVGAQVLAGLPLEPVVLGEIARARGLDPGRDLTVDTLFLGGAALPPAFQRILGRAWRARVIELYGSTETMLLGTSCARGTLHLATELAYCEVLVPGTGTDRGGEGRLVVTTLGLEASPLVRFDTGDVVRLLPTACACGDRRPGIIVLGRVEDAVELAGRCLYPYDLVDAGATVAEVLESAVFFTVILPGQMLVRVETRVREQLPAAQEALHARLPGVPVEVEALRPGALLDVELLSRGPRVYKPVVTSDWRRPGRQLLTVGEGLMEWPRPSFGTIVGWLRRLLATARRRRQLRRRFGLARAERR
ncbi:MAG TPA: AMP-binding protein [Candidatus Nitrosopolaris sp.]|nr:AMP-binding protein [Candidatus Nitrosopolaris sp.]